MRKNLCAVLAAIMTAVFMGGCGGGSQTGVSDADDNEQVAIETPTPTATATPMATESAPKPRIPQNDTVDAVSDQIEKDGETSAATEQTSVTAVTAEQAEQAAWQLGRETLDGWGAYTHHAVVMANDFYTESGIAVFDVYEDFDDRVLRLFAVKVDLAMGEIFKNEGFPDEWVYVENCSSVLGRFNRVQNVEDDIWLTGAEIVPTDSGFAVKLMFTADGAKKFADLTTKMVGNMIYLYHDDAPFVAPTAGAPITNGEVIIEAGFDEKQARRFADEVNALIAR